MAAAEQTTGPTVTELLNSGALAGEWTLDPARSTVSLKSKSMFGLARVNGVFRQVTGVGTISASGQVSGGITVAAASIDTRNTKRDIHLRSADLLDTGNHPDIVFTVESIKPSSAQNATATATATATAVAGALNIRGRARRLTFDGTAAVSGDGEVWLDATVDINRADFDITWNVLGMASMNNTLTVHAVLTKE
jgi:polyisoprenoid-binding protein YceI